MIDRNLAIAMHRRALVLLDKEEMETVDTERRSRNGSASSIGADNFSIGGKI
jgi:hypothetical protein